MDEAVESRVVPARASSLDPSCYPAGKRLAPVVPDTEWIFCLISGEISDGNVVRKANRILIQDEARRWESEKEAKVLTQEVCRDGVAGSELLPDARSWPQHVGPWIRRRTPAIGRERRERARMRVLLASPPADGQRVARHGGVGVRAPTLADEAASRRPGSA